MTASAARIVVGVDGSPASVEALRWAVAQAKLTASKVEAIISWLTPAQYGFEFSIASTDWADIARRTLDTAIEQAGDGGTAEVSSCVLEGHPAQVLVRASIGAQLLVVGSRGHGGFAGLLLGSVSEYVIAHATCPVLVIRHPMAAAAPMLSPLPSA
jgi:nucleotide-binding universal stress UspA family protein